VWAAFAFLLFLYSFRPDKALYCSFIVIWVEEHGSWLQHVCASRLICVEGTLHNYKACRMPVCQWLSFATAAKAPGCPCPPTWCHFSLFSSSPMSPSHFSFPTFTLSSPPLPCTFLCLLQQQSGNSCQTFSAAGLTLTSSVPLISRAACCVIRVCVCICLAWTQTCLLLKV